MTESSRWEEVRDAFLELAECAPEDRAERLVALRRERPAFAREVEELLANDREEEGGSTSGPAPMRFGPYEVVRPIGRGGMGEVFVARRADGEYEREVAIKLLRAVVPDEELVRRFQRERQMLARLDHEYVAKLLDGGTTQSGAPYLVMEYVDGERADRFAAKLPLDERLRLFMRIGEAVQHAHEHGFVHRDLKPSNVLVRSDGTPRLLDFGIARADESGRSMLGVEGDGEPTLTETGRRLFTPDYASPEQVRGEVATTRSDVFALGVLLYVFLCGEKPWPAEAPLHRLEQAILEDEPRPPSRRVSGRTRGRLAGDLDAITLQCLAKDPRRRYASVADLCEDIERHLEGRTIRARRTGVFGRGMRLARRRPAIPALVALLLFALATGWIALQLQQRDVGRQEGLYEAVRERIVLARSLRTDGLFDAADEELERGLETLAELPPAPELEAEVVAQLANHAELREESERALELLDRADALLEGVVDPDVELVQRILNVRTMASAVVRPEDHFAAAERSYQHALARIEPGHALRVDAQLHWADLNRTLGRTDEGYAVVATELQELVETSPRNDVIPRILNDRGVMFAHDGRYAEAVESYRETLEHLAWHYGEGHRNFAMVRLNLGSSLLRLGRLDEARVEYERSLETSRSLVDEELTVASNLHFLARVYAADDELERAEAAAREALSIREGYDLGFHLDRTRCQLGIVLLRRGEHAEAQALLAGVLDEYAPGTLLDDMAFEARWRFGAWLQDEDRADEAEPHLRAAMELAGSGVVVDEDLLLELEGRLAVLDLD